ncbi:MAG: hypothetical protein ACJATT_000763 [Myxococcota bacterium]|jgi:hypothetical protein
MTLVGTVEELKRRQLSSDVCDKLRLVARSTMMVTDVLDHDGGGEVVGADGRE